MVSWHGRFKPLRALRRRLGLTPNVLRRPADRAESSIMLALLLAFFIGAPVLGLLIGRSSYDAGMGTERAQAVRHAATARLTADAGPSASFYEAGSATVPVTARWTYAGVVHVGKIRALPGTKAGTKVTISVDRYGLLVTRKQTHMETVGNAAVMGGASVLSLGFVCWLAGVVVRRTFIHRQLAAWDADWSAFEPRWTGRTGS
jgi:hypothetical protein